MPCAIYRAATPSILLLFLAQFLLISCARPPWTSVIEGPPKKVLDQAFSDFISSQDRCLSSWDSELTIKWHSTLQTFSVNAYCQALKPSYLKFVVSNPLGQPLKIISVNDQTYQVIDASEKTSVAGNLRSWAKDNDIPTSLVERPWLAWLQGHASATTSQIIEMRLDGQNRGAWLSMAVPGSERISEYLLFDGESQKIVERVILDDLGKKIAVIEYRHWQLIDKCPFPEEITIGELPLGTQAWLGFTETRWRKLAPADFSLDIPPGFQTVVLP